MKKRYFAVSLAVMTAVSLSACKGSEVTPAPTEAPTQAEAQPTETETAPTEAPKEAEVTPTEAPASPVKTVPEGIVVLNAQGRIAAIPDNDALNFTRDMKAGWNLGNAFDANNCDWLSDPLDYESAWCGAKTTKELIHTIKEAGFNTIRIPVSWHNHLDASWNIDQKWMDRVQEVVDWAYDEGMYVIINIHHDEDQFQPSEAHYEEAAHYIACIWQQIAERFRDYDDHLIMESMNEPRLVNSPYEWNFVDDAAECIEAADALNRLNQLFVDTVRATGGNNADRYLMVPASDANPWYAVKDSYVLPTDSADNRIIVSAHAYTPYPFALQDGGTGSFSLQDQSQTNEIIYFMNALYDRYIAQGIPVVIGEFGARAKGSNLQDRVDFTAFYTAAASARNMPCLWWDNNAFTGNGELFGIFDRKSVTFRYPDIVNAMMTYGGYEKLHDPQ